MTKVHSPNVTSGMNGHLVGGPWGTPVRMLPHETILDACLRQGVDMAFSCRGGTCHTCLMRCVHGDVPERAQRGLPEELKSLNYLLPCVCIPQSLMLLENKRPQDFVTLCRIEKITKIVGGVHLCLEPLGAIAVQQGERVLIDAHEHGAIEARVTGLPEEEFYLSLEVDSDTDVTWIWDRSPERTVRVRPTGEIAAALPTMAVESADTSGDGLVLPPPDVALWGSLKDGALVRAVLDDFYDAVYADSKLAPYFRGVTKDHVAGKQYSFLKRCMTGERVYFGDTPRNVHHWMVISDALFDHRQNLMRDAQRRHGLTERQMAGWDAYELPFRGDIVKTEPFPLVQFGHVKPLEGFEEMPLDVGAVCDSCGSVLEPGTTVRYHLRLGTISCPNCNQPAR